MIATKTYNEVSKEWRSHSVFVSYVSCFMNLELRLEIQVYDSLMTIYIGYIDRTAQNFDPLPKYSVEVTD